ncbi:MAG: tetratricopeptide repeat protein, partial [Salinibacter sp.]
RTSRCVAATLQAEPAIVPPSPDSGKHPAPAVQRHLVKGTTEALLDDPKEAILYYEAALERAPGAPVLLQALADAHAAQGDYTTALFYARKAQQRAPERVYYHRRLAELQRKAGHPEAAMHTYQTLLDRFPNHVRAYRALATLQANQGRPEAALATYQTLLDHAAFPRVSVYEEMLTLYRRIGDADGITSTLRTLVNRRPNNRRYRRLLGKHYAEQGRPNAALDLLRPLARQQPDAPTLQRTVRMLSRKTSQTESTEAPSPSRPPSGSVDALVRRADSLLTASSSGETRRDSARLRAAGRLLRRAADRSPKRIGVLTLRAHLFEKRGAYLQAGRILKRSLEINPRSRDRWARAAAAFLHGHEYAKASSVAEEGLLLFPGTASLRRTAALARLRGGAPTKALDHFQKALDLYRTDSARAVEIAVARAGMGLAYTFLDRPKKADAAFEKALAQAPRVPDVLAPYAYSLAVRETRLDRALDLARRAVAQSSSDPRPLDVLGWVYFKRGRPKRARRILAKALDAGVPSPRTLEHFGDVQHALGNDDAARTYWKRALKRGSNAESLRKKLDEVPPS